MNAHARHEEARALRMTRQQVADLLHRYPRVSDTEARLILTFLRKGRHLDVGMLTADDRLNPHLDSFMADHAKYFRISVGEAAMVIAMIVGFLTVCWLVWEAVRPATVQ
jgi:hypothetical protein